MPSGRPAAVGRLTAWRRLAALRSSARAAAFEARGVLSSAAFWRVMVAELMLLGTRLQFSILDNGILGMFLVRHFGEATPILRIHSINLWGDAFFSPVVSALLAHIPPLGSWRRVIIPGVLIMSIAPVWMVLSPTVGGACVYAAHITAGEVIWAPRKTAWVASVAPRGREGAFLALSKLRNFLSDPLNDQINGYVQTHLNPNCQTCRDGKGHFCEHPLSCTAATGGWDTAFSAGGAVWLRGGAIELSLAEAEPHSNASAALCAALAQRGYDRGCYAAVEGGEAALCLSHSHDAAGLAVGSATGGFADGLVAAPGAAAPLCPRTCQGCPGYASRPQAMWGFVLGVAMTSPVLLSLVGRWLDRGTSDGFARSRSRTAAEQHDPLV